MSVCCSLTSAALAVLCMVGVVVFVYQWWLMHSLPTTDIAELEDKLSEIKGEVSPLSELLTSPRAGTPCVYYKLQVQEQVGVGDEEEWKTVIDETEYAMCIVQDDTGACELDLRQAETTLEVDTQEEGVALKDEAFVALLEQRGFDAQDLSSRRFQLTETVIPEGDKLYVIGDVQLRDGNFPLIENSTRYFMVTDGSEEEMKSTHLAAAGFLAFCALGSIFSAVFFWS